MDAEQIWFKCTNCGASGLHRHQPTCTECGAKQPDRPDIAPRCNHEFLGSVCKEPRGHFPTTPHKATNGCQWSF